MKILHMTDMHFSAITPIARLDNYQEAVFTKLAEIRTIIKRENVDCVTISGDWFHLKSWSRNPYGMTNRLIDYFRSIEVPIVGIFGDHDSPDRREDSISRQPLGTLVKATHIRLLSKGEEYLLGDHVFITGSSKIDAYEDDLTNYIPNKIGEAKLHLHLVHGDLYPKPPQYSPYTLFSQLKDSPADFTFAGHVHADLGETKVGNTTIVNRGSLTRGTFNTDNVRRKPMVYILDTSTRKIKYIELASAQDSSKIFDIEKKILLDQAERELYSLGALIKMEAGNVELSGPEGIRLLVKEMKSLKEPVRSKIFELLDRAEEAT